MKNLFKKALLPLATICAILWSCNSLEEKTDFASPDTFYKTEADMNAAINGAYTPFNKEWFNVAYNRCVIDCALGVQTGYEKGPQYYRTGGYVASDEYITTFWAQLYDGVNRANVVLDAIGKIDAKSISADRKKTISGEAHILRAMYYYHLFSYFENIPVPTGPTRELGNFSSNEGGKQKVLDLMVADLIAAESELPASWSGADTGRPGKWAAKTLLAKVYLERAEWQKAADKANEVITQSGIQLFDDFNKVFDVTTKNQGERLFETQCNQFVSPWVNYNNMHAHFTPTDWDGGNPNTLETGDGVTAAGWGDAWIVGDNKFREDIFPANSNDKRIKVTFMDQYRSKHVGGDVVRYSPNAPSPFVAPNSPSRQYKNVIIQKWIEYKIGGWQNTQKNYGLIRLSDAYLAHAEAVARGATGNGLASLNEVRTKHGGLPTLGALTVDATLNEWLREFAGEGWAFPTVRRYGKTAEFIAKYAGRQVDNNKFRLLPIPLVEIQANPGVKQNPGW
jgi:starch-binding outer membrane protein, SusD/RagB family